jgi:hypothetical protein
MTLSRKDLKALQRAADVAQAQQRLLRRNTSEAGWRDAIIGTAAGLSLLLLSGLAVQGMIRQDRSEGVTAGEQVVWNQPERVTFLR